MEGDVIRMPEVLQEELMNVDTKFYLSFHCVFSLCLVLFSFRML